MSAIGTLSGVLFVLVFAVAVTSKGALKGPDAFALRWTVLSLAVAVSGLAAWLRWKMSQPQKGAHQARAAAVPHVGRQHANCQQRHACELERLGRP